MQCESVEVPSTSGKQPTVVIPVSGLGQQVPVLWLTSPLKQIFWPATPVTGPVQVEVWQVPVASEGFVFVQMVPETQLPALLLSVQQVEPTGRSVP